MSWNPPQRPIKASPPRHEQSFPLPPSTFGTAEPTPRISAGAIAALVLGIVGLPCVWVFGSSAAHKDPSSPGSAGGAAIFLLTGVLPVLALVFGLVAQSQIRRMGGRQRGLGMAVAAIALGTMGILVGGYFALSILHGIQCNNPMVSNTPSDCVSAPSPNGAAITTPPGTPIPTPTPGASVGQQTAEPPSAGATSQPAPATVGPPQGALFPTVIDAALRFASSRSRAPTVGPTELPGATPGSMLTPAVFTSQNEILTTLQFGGDGQPEATQTTPTGPNVYGDFSSLLYSSHAAAVNNLSVDTGPLTNTSSIPFGGGTATLDTAQALGGSLVLTWVEGSWTIAVEGSDQHQDVDAVQQLGSFLFSHPMPSGPGVYTMFLSSGLDESEARWVQNAAQIGASALGADPTLAGQLAGVMRTWPSGTAG